LNAMSCCVSQSIAEIGISSIGRSRSNGVSRVQILDSEVNVVILLGVFLKIRNHKMGEVDVLSIATIINFV
jgi:hypothetical protein